MTKFEPIYMTEESLEKERLEAKESGHPSTFLDAEHYGGVLLANLLDQIIKYDPEITLDRVQGELQMFSDFIGDYQNEYGEEAPLSLIQ